MSGVPGEASGGYRAPSRASQAEIREKGSRFRAFVVPAADEEEAREALERLRRRFPDASHHCWAWRLGPEPSERSSDAGEPAGTAGVPILRVLAGRELSDVLAVVVRWFGGTKLGKGGLARAYSEAVREAVAGLAVETRLPTVDLLVEAPYPSVGALKRLVRPPEIELVSESYGEFARVVLRVAERRRPDLESAIRDLRLICRPAPEEYGGGVQGSKGSKGSNGR